MRHFTPAANVSERQELPPPVAVSTVIFAVRAGHLEIPLVKRTRQPFFGQWALPGGPVTWDESLTDVAQRTLADTTGLSPNYLEQLYTFGEVNRSRAERIVSIVYWAQIAQQEVDEGDDNVAWFKVSELPELAFDHSDIIDYALGRLRAKVELAHGFLPTEFTLAELRGAYEAVLGRALDGPNFRRQVLAENRLEETGRLRTAGAHRPAKLYRVKPSR